MTDENGVVDYRLDALTKTVRFTAGIAPRTATRVSLGVALALEDAATDPAGELLGAKLHQGASALSSAAGAIASSVGDSVRTRFCGLAAKAESLPPVPALQKTKDLVGQAATELRDSWASAGYVTVQVEQPQAQESDGPDVTSAGHQLSPSTAEAIEEVTN